MIIMQPLAAMSDGNRKGDQKMEEYKRLTLEIIEFECADVIVTSGEGDSGADSDWTDD